MQAQSVRTQVRIKTKKSIVHELRTANVALSMSVTAMAPLLAVFNWTAKDAVAAWVCDGVRGSVLASSALARTRRAAAGTKTDGGAESEGEYRGTLAPEASLN